MQGIVFDNIEWFGKRTRAPLESIDRLDTIVGNLTKDTAAFMHYSITEKPENAYY